MKVAMLHHKYRNDGVARVISQLIPIFISSGIEVVLITEEETTQFDFVLPNGVMRYKIESEYLTSGIYGDVILKKREEHLAQILLHEKVDIICHHDLSCQVLKEDIETIHSCKIKIIGVKHELFSQWLVSGIDSLTYQREAFVGLDALVVLSNVEKNFWQQYGIESIVVNNPCPVYNNDTDYNPDNTDLLWIGRLDRNQKCYIDAIKIVAELKKIMPHIRLNMYGSPDTIQDYFLLNKYIRLYSVEDNVIYHGYLNSVESAYHQAAVMLVTSSFESFPMNIYESKVFGLPLVTYEMPYLELLQQTEGFIAIPQKQYKRAAQVLAQLLNDKQLRMKLSVEAKNSVRQYNSLDLANEWEKVFHLAMYNNAKTHSSNQDGKIIWDTFIFHQSLLCQKFQELQLENKRLKEEKQLHEIKQIMKEKSLKLVIYPNGRKAKELCDLLKQNDIEIDFMVDNNNYDSENVFSFDSIKNIEKYYFIIASDSVDCGIEIRNEIDKYVSKSNQYDWYLNL